MRIAAFFLLPAAAFAFAPAARPVSFCGSPDGCVELNSRLWLMGHWCNSCNDAHEKINNTQSCRNQPCLAALQNLNGEIYCERRLL